MAEPEVNDDNFIYQVGLLPTRELALNFVDYVASRGLKATAKAEFSGAFGIYVARAEDVPRPIARRRGNEARRCHRSVKRNGQVLAFGLCSLPPALPSLSLSVCSCMA